MPPNVLTFKDLGVEAKKVTEGFPIEHLRHYRVGGYDFGERSPSDCSPRNSVLVSQLSLQQLQKVLSLLSVRFNIPVVCRHNLFNSQHRWCRLWGCRLYGLRLTPIEGLNIRSKGQLVAGGCCS